MIKANQKMYFLGLGILIIGLVFGYVLGSALNYQRGLAQGRLEAETEYKEKLSEFIPELAIDESTGRELDFFSGTVENIEDNALTVKTTIYPLNPLNDSLQKNYRVLITSETTIVRQLEKTEAEMEEESLGAEDPPDPTKEIAVDFREIIKGAKVAVQAGENIFCKQTFEAVKIILID